MIKRFGFIREKLEIKILILFILRRISTPVSFDELTELALCDDGICYFVFTECVAEMVDSGHLICRDGEYSITKKGLRNGELTENNLPFTVRAHLENTTFAYRSSRARNAMINTSHVTEPDGTCIVKLSLSDGIGEVVSIELFTVNERQALALENGFRKSAESIYSDLIEMILGQSK